MKPPPNSWNLLTPHNEFKAFVSSLPVVNDEAEKNVKLMQDFISGSQSENHRKDLFFGSTAKKKELLL